MTTIVVNVKKKYLANHDNFEEWLKDSNNLYVGRHGRIFIGSKDNKKIFHFKGSKWKNPFIVGKDGNRQEVYEKYKNALISKELIDIDGDPLIDKIDELKHKKLGCWCHPELCHAHILAELCNKYII